METETNTQEVLKIPTEPLANYTSLTPEHDIQFKVKEGAENVSPIPEAPCSIKISYTSFIYTTNTKFDENQEYEFRLGINYEKETLNDVVVEAWDMVLKSGKVQVGNEVEIVCGPKYGYGEEGNEDKKVGKEEWLKYEMKVIEAKEEEKTKWDYQPEQRKQLAIEWKGEANQLFKSGDFEKASEIYKKAFEFVDDENDEQCKEMKKQILGNLSLVAFKNKNWAECIQKAGEVLEEDKTNVKALFRKGMAYLEMNDLEKAKVDLEEAYKLDKSNKEILVGLQKVYQKLKEFKQKEKKVFSNMFSEPLFVDEKKEELVEEPTEQDTTPSVPNPQVYFDVTIGEKPAQRLEFELFANKVPKTAENFRCLCTGEKGTGKCGKELHFKNTIFHRLIKDFMIQGGDFENSNGTGGESIYGNKFDDENFSMKHTGRGLLSMANSGKNTNGSQFFVTFKNTEWLDNKHVVFGKLIKGQEFLDEIEKVSTHVGDVPTEQLKIVDCGEIPKTED